MNTIKLCGGLGNQLFQYAFGKAQIAEGIKVCYDKSWYNSLAAKNSNRHHILDKFQTTVAFGERQPGRAVHEKGFNKTFLLMDGFYFSGYWQYPAYSEKVLPVLRQEFQLKEEFHTPEFLITRKEIVDTPNSIAIHVRRGDYLQLNGFPVMGLDYFLRALEYVRGDVYIFSDDIEWCRANFKNAQFVHFNEYLDFELMKLCRHQIISRSSYSWWAAYLNDNPDKIVVCPKEQLECAVRQKAMNRENEVFDPKEWIIC
jgi:hypothetical protein